MNKFKKFLLNYKLDFIKRVAPEIVTHWNETNKTVTFYQTQSFDESIEPIVVKKPAWLRLVEFVAYKVLK